MTRESILLVVDDDVDVRDTTAEILRLAGYAVYTGASGDVALCILAKGVSPDVFLLDVKMPGMTGLQLLERIDIRSRLSEAVMMTGHESVRDAQRAMELGACGYITKPADAASILGEVRRALESVSRKREKSEQVTQLRENADAATRELAFTQQALEERERLMDGILTSMEEGILTLDRAGRIVYMNRRAQEILQLRFGECAGEELTTAALGHAWAEPLRRIMETGARAAVNPVLTLHGGGEGVRHYLVNVSDFRGRDGAVVGMIVDLVDHTAKVEAERVREYFLTTVAHEFRTPLSVLLNYISALKATPPGAAGFHEVLNDMREAGLRLKHLADSVISVADGTSD